MSPETLPTVRKMSGTASTATRMPSSSIGTPIAIEIGATLATKEISPGRPTDPMLIAIATKPPTTICVGRELDAKHGGAEEHDAKVCDRAGHAEHGDRQRQDDVRDALGHAHRIARPLHHQRQRGERRPARDRDGQHRRGRVEEARRIRPCPTRMANRKAIGTMAAVTTETMHDVLHDQADDADARRQADAERQREHADRRRQQHPAHDDDHRVGDRAEERRPSGRAARREAASRQSRRTAQTPPAAGSRLQPQPQSDCPARAPRAIRRWSAARQASPAPRRRPR